MDHGPAQSDFLSAYRQMDPQPCVTGQALVRLYGVSRPSGWTSGQRMTMYRSGAVVTVGSVPALAATGFDTAVTVVVAVALVVLGLGLLRVVAVRHR